MNKDVVETISDLSVRVTKHRKAWIPRKLRDHDAVTSLRGRKIKHVRSIRDDEIVFLIVEGTEHHLGRAPKMPKNLRLTIPENIAKEGDFLYFFTEQNKLYYTVCQ